MGYFGFTNLNSSPFSFPLTRVNTCELLIRFFHSSLFLPSMKYVLVSGGVISGIGKGVIASSTGLLLKTIGLKICGSLYPIPYTLYHTRSEC